MSQSLACSHRHIFDPDRKFWRQPSPIAILTEMGGPREVVFELILCDLLKAKLAAVNDIRHRSRNCRYSEMAFKTLRAGHYIVLLPCYSSHRLGMLWDWSLRIPDVTDPMLTSSSNDSLVHFCQRKLKPRSPLPRADSGTNVQLRLWS